jgi:hypothetical protein
MPNGSEKDSADPATLKLDLSNPRAGDRSFSDEKGVLSYLIRTADIDELVTSIQSAGWIDFEPLIVQCKTRIVFEGNRRLAALRLISDQATRESVGYRLPAVDGPKPLPASISVRWVSGRDEARSFIAFKHINGPAKWDALAKARYAAEWLAEGEPLEKVSKSIGDTHNTVLRMVNGWRVLRQATAEGFDRSDITARRFNFSHLYTALARPNVHEYLGLQQDLDAELQENPIVKDKVDALADVMGWLFGQAKQGRQHVIKSQNPDLNMLIRILGNAQARTALAATKDLKVWHMT